MKELWLGDWEDTQFNGMKTDFEIDTNEYDDINVIVGYYNQEYYEGDAMVIFEQNDKLFIVHGGHCSCYGLEEQWEPEEITIDYLTHMIDNGRFTYRNDDDNEIKKHLKEYISVAKREDNMKIGTKVRCEDGFSTYCGYLACIEEGNIYPYNVVLRESDVGKSFFQLLNEYGFDADDFGIFKLEDLTEV